MIVSKQKQLMMIVFSLLLVFSVLFVVLFYMYQGSLIDERAAYEEEELRILVHEDLIGQFSLSHIKQLLEPTVFTAIYRSRGTAALKKEYKGFLLKDLFFSLGISLDARTQVRFVAADGFERIYSIDDVLMEDNVFIAYEVDGLLFSTRDLDRGSEDGGPFVAIRAQDEFSQHRVKMLSTIILE